MKRIGGFFKVRLGFWGLIVSATAVVCACTVSGFLGALWWPFDLAANFRVQYVGCLLLAAVLFLVGKKWLWAIVSGVFVLVNLLEIVPSLVPVSRQDASSPNKVRILLANVLSSNRQYDKLREFIRSAKPDIIVVIEASDGWMKALSAFAEKYPHVVSRPREDNFGIALFSRFPFVESEIIEIGGAEIPTAVGRVQIAEKEVTIIVTHPVPPVGSRSALRNRQLKAVAEHVRSLKRPVIIVGDLNTTPWSPHFKRLLRRAGLRDSRRGRGIHPTWPAGLPWPLRIPLDHVLCSPEIIVLRRELGPKIGSDHLPVVVDLSLRGTGLSH